MLADALPWLPSNKTFSLTGLAQGRPAGNTKLPINSCLPQGRKTELTLRATQKEKLRLLPRLGSLGGAGLSTGEVCHGMQEEGGLGTNLIALFLQQSKVSLSDKSHE